MFEASEDEWKRIYTEQAVRHCASARANHRLGSLLSAASAGCVGDELCVQEQRERLLVFERSRRQLAGKTYVSFRLCRPHCSFAACQKYASQGEAIVTVILGSCRKRVGRQMC
jgi:hypothetical protein